jgi:hypothetical protein
MDGANGREGAGSGEGRECAEGAERAGRGDRMADALSHLQVAALELVEAARAALDVAEDLVREPAVALLLAGTVAEALRATQSAAGARPPPEPRASGAEPAAPGSVARIRVDDDPIEPSSPTADAAGTGDAHRPQAGTGGSARGRG